MSEKIYEFLDRIRPVSTVHVAGEKQVFLSEVDTESNITQFAYGRFTPGEGCEEHSHQTMEECFFFIRGYGVYKVENELIDIKPNTFFRIRPDIRHYIKNTGDSNLEFIYFGVAIEKI
jgi:mannose-6-phosphate isomerase-like protein (cupin superfamily)